MSEKKELTLGEKATNWAKAISLFGAALVALYAAFLKGEPQAAMSYEELADRINKISKNQEELTKDHDKHKAFIDGFLEGLKHQRPTEIKITRPAKSYHPRPEYYNPAPPAPKLKLEKPKLKPLPKTLEQLQQQKLLKKKLM